jgi:hypothetical protein
MLSLPFGLVFFDRIALTFLLPQLVPNLVAIVIGGTRNQHAADSRPRHHPGDVRVRDALS